MKHIGSKVFFGILVLVAIAAAIAVFIRLIPFDTSDVRVTIDAPRELDIGAEDTVFVTIFNGSRATLRDGSVTIDLPDNLEIMEREGESFDTLGPREQITARYVIRASGEPGVLTEILARARFRPRQLSASFTKSARANLLLRDLPFSIDFAFPADISPGVETTFTIEVSSDTDSPIGPVGVELDLPFDFSVTRFSPEPVDKEDIRWDFGEVDSSFREEIQVTGMFPLEASEGSFSARIGLLDSGRFELKSFRQIQESLTLRSSEVQVDLFLNDHPVSGQEVVTHGDELNIDIRYRNTTNEPVNGMQIVVAAAHDLIQQRSVTSNEPYTRSVSGEYVFEGPAIAKLNQVQPGEGGEIALTLPLESKLLMRSFSDAHQSFVVRARVASGGQVLGERQVEFKLVGQIGVDAEVLYYNAPGGSNSGPLPPRVGEQTTYTVVLGVLGGTNGLDDVVARVVLAPGVSYIGPVDPLDNTANSVTVNSATRELAWNIGAIPPGVGVLSDPKQYIFRIGLTPTPDMIGETPTLLETVTVAGEDTFIGRILDASDLPVDTTLRDDRRVANATLQQVEPASGMEIPDESGQ